jgi:hypothetical protein
MLAPPFVEPLWPSKAIAFPSGSERRLSPRCLWVVNRSADPHADSASVAKGSLRQIRCPGQRTWPPNARAEAMSGNIGVDHNDQTTGEWCQSLAEMMQAFTRVAVNTARRTTSDFGKHRTLEGPPGSHRDSRMRRIRQAAPRIVAHQISSRDDPRDAGLPRHAGINAP